MRRLTAFLCLLVFATACTSPGRPLEPDPTLARYSTVTYTVYQGAPGDALAVSRFEGLLTHRKAARLEAVGRGYAGDGLGNLIRFEPLVEEGNLIVRSVTQTADGATFVGWSDPNSPEVVNRAIGVHAGGIWYLDDAPDPRVTRCINAFTETGDLGGLLECLGFSSSADSGLDPLPELAGWQQPDCPGQSTVTEDPPRYTAGTPFRDREEFYNFVAGATGNAETARLARNAAAAAAEAAYQFERLEEVTNNNAPTSVIKGTAEDAALAKAKLANAEKELLDHLERNNEPVPDPASTGSGGALNDPRCAGREVDESRGNLFSNAHFCPDHDFIGCLQRQEDALAGMTEGQCYRDEGPAGAPIIVCRPKDDEVRPPDPGTGAGSDPVGPVTDPNAPLNSRGQIQTRYLDTTPLGAFLLGLCAKGGCPDRGR